ncbi:MAG: hypothetical protein H8D47_01410 [Planctomycetes bacterium]|nr:hypothetical protein [Planctomycetota bacterium]MBL7106379.1 hypothetical protein [Phycisphaerae bacterium]
MNNFVEKNTRLLKFYGITARIIGWLVVLWAAIPAVFLCWMLLRTNENRTASLGTLQELVFQRMLVGIIMLGVAQFIRYLFDAEYRPGWILRHGDYILYVYAVALTGAVIWSYIHTAKILGESNLDIVRDWRWLMLLPSVLLFAAKVLILVGLAQILRRAMPMIEESRTLV